jgi:hypothetical protein
MLDYIIRDPLAHSISPEFYGCTGRGGSSSMIPELRYWVQFFLATQFPTACIPPSLASVGPTGTAASEWEQPVPITVARTQEAEC